MWIDVVCFCSVWPNDFAFKYVGEPLLTFSIFWESMANPSLVLALVILQSKQKLISTLLEHAYLYVTTFSCYRLPNFWKFYCLRSANSAKLSLHKMNCFDNLYGIDDFDTTFAVLLLLQRFFLNQLTVVGFQISIWHMNDFRVNGIRQHQHIQHNLKSVINTRYWHSLSFVTFSKYLLFRSLKWISIQIMLWKTT